MKKKRFFYRRDLPKSPRNVFLIMKLTFVLCVFLTFSLSAKLYSQQEKISLNLNNVTLEEVIDALKKQTGISFFYNSSLFKDAPRVSLHVTNEPLDKLLTDILGKEGFVYDFRDDVVVIKKSAETAPQDQKNKVVEGIVLDNQKAPLPGVTVRVKGLTVGTATDVNGKFAISVPAQNEPVILVFSFVGFETQEVKVNFDKPISIVLKEKVAEIEEVVVTGYGNIKKSSFTGSATTISKAELQKVSTTNIIQSLQVFDPSLRIAPNNLRGSDPNTLPEFYIRGRSGMNGVQELDKMENMSKYALTNNPNLPVFMLDGFEVSSEKIYDLDLNIIKSVTILKDAAATAIYGSRASNGVIVIETEAPKGGKLRATYNYVGTVTAPDLTDYHLMNAREKLDAELAAGLLDEIDPTYPSQHTYPSRLEEYRMKESNISRGVDTYWLSKPLQTEFNNKHSFYVEGGENSVRFAIGLRYESRNGVMKESGRKNMGADVKIDYRLKNLIISNNSSFSNVRTQESPYGLFGDYVKQQPYYSPTDFKTGEWVKTLPGYWGNSAPTVNPLYEATLENFNRGGYNEFIDNLSVNWHFTKAWQLKAQFAINYKNDFKNEFTDPASAIYNVYNKPIFEKGELYKNKTDILSWNTNILFLYSNAINDHYINTTVGINAKEDIYDYSFSHFRGFPNGSLSDQKYAHEIVTVPDLQDNHTRLAGVLFTTNYTYKNIYLADVSVRFDGSSEFGSKNRYAPFWSAGIGLNAHNYEALKNSIISRLRFTLNYGQTGKVNFPPYAARFTYELLTDTWNSTGIGAVLYYMGNEELKWEKTNNLNAGMDLGFFGDRLNLTLTWYDKHTIDLIADVTLPTSSGFTIYKDNMGEVSNRGFEAMLSAAIVKTSDLDVNAFVRTGHTKNKIIKISNTLQAYNDRVDEYYSEYQEYYEWSVPINSNNAKYSKPLLKYEEGGSLTSIVGMKSLGIAPANGKELYENRDGSTTYQWDASQQQILGNTDPDLSGSFGLNARYKNLTLYTSFLFEAGGQIYNQTLVDNVENLNVWERNGDIRVFSERWQKPGDISKLKSIKDRYQTTRPTSRFVQDNNVITFNSLSLGYNFNSTWMDKVGISMLKLAFNMNDVARISSVKAERGIDYPFARSFSFSLNLGF